MQSPRVAIITGAAQGLGKSIAARLFQDGYNIAINDIPGKTKQLEEVAREIEGDSGKTGRVLIAPADVSVESEVKSMVERVVEELGSLDVVSSTSSLADSSHLWGIVRWWRMQGSLRLRPFMIVSARTFSVSDRKGF